MSQIYVLNTAQTFMQLTFVTRTGTNWQLSVEASRSLNRPYERSLLFLYAACNLAGTCSLWQRCGGVVAGRTSDVLNLHAVGRSEGHAGVCFFWRSS